MVFCGAGGTYTVTVTATKAAGFDVAAAVILVTEFDIYLPLIVK